PPPFVYDAFTPPSAVARTLSAAAGTDTMVQIDAVNTNFVDGQTAIGFGSSDVTVRRVWVTAPGRLLLNLSVSPQASPGPLTMSLISGLEAVPLNSGFQVSPPSPNQVSLRANIVSVATGQAIVPAGSFALITAPGVPQNLTGWSLTIGSQRVLFSANGPGQIVAQVPAGLAVGPAIVQLSSPTATVPPVVLQVDPPVILAAVNGSGAAIDASHPARPGDTVQLTVFGFADFSSQALLSGVQINVGGVTHGATSVTLSQGQSGAYVIQFALSPNVPSGAQTSVTA